MSETSPRGNSGSIFSSVNSPTVNPIISRSPFKISSIEENVRRTSSQYHVNCAPSNDSRDSLNTSKFSKEQTSKMSPNTTSPKSNKDSKISTPFNSNKHSSFHFSKSPSFTYASKLFKKNSFKENKTSDSFYLFSKTSPLNKLTIETVKNKILSSPKSESKLFQKDSFDKTIKDYDSKLEEQINSESASDLKQNNSPKTAGLQNVSQNLFDTFSKEYVSAQNKKEISTKVTEKETEQFLFQNLSEVCCMNNETKNTSSKSSEKFSQDYSFNYETEKSSSKNYSDQENKKSSTKKCLDQEEKKTPTKISKKIFQENLNENIKNIQLLNVEKSLETSLNINKCSTDTVAISSKNSEISLINTPEKVILTNAKSPKVGKKKDENQDPAELSNNEGVQTKFYKSAFLSDLKNIFSEISYEDVEFEGIEKDEELINIYSPPKMNLEMNYNEFYTLNQTIHSSVFKHIIDLSKKYNKIFNSKKSIFDTKFSIGSRIVKICDEMSRVIQTMDTTISSDPNSLFILFTKLENLKELIQCWLLPSPRPTIQKFEDNIIKLYNAFSDLSLAFLDSKKNFTNPRKISENALNKLIFLIGKRLLEINISLEESLWFCLDETVADNLAKGSSTQFSITLHSILEQLLNSQMQISSLAYQSFVEKKSESIKSLLEVAIEFMNEIQKVMKQFKLWHENQNGDNTLTKCYELQFLWHSENYQYVNMIHSLVIDLTQSISKIISEHGDSSDVHEMEKLLNYIETNLEGIQRSLPFSSESESEFDSDANSNLITLESLIRSTITTIGKLKHLINTSFNCGKSILKKVATYYAKDLSGLIIKDGKDELRRVHFSESFEST